ncbi:uncharacterized protein LOC111651662 [Seriola lalandi dorsalis]|uniref:uncharacterized protein LOC111651662 n=1 Tax=Seriola lalandi dorsalis TaxID=1841481 RepID=UPI000C6F6C80|nr:uncharacterized protein LOC111651662 [Seriola lalandi dorsalis]
MASTLVPLLQLLLVSLVSASHYYGGTVTFSYKGQNPDGSHRVDIRNRDTFDGCQYSLSSYCSSGNCGQTISSQRGVLDRSTNAPRFNRQWCETETVITKKLWSEKPFQERAASCCWIPKRNGNSNWRLLTHVDLGKRSDTRQPNRSPDIAILPFLRVPQNCPRTYNLMSTDPDGDQVRCRYGNAGGTECSSCNQPSGFHLDQDSCTLHYNNTFANPRVFGFELVVEDYPQGHITLAYTDGSRSARTPLARRRKRQASHTYQTTTTPPTTHNWWWWSNHSPTTAPHPWGQWSTTWQTPTTTTPSTSWWWWHSTTTPSTTPSTTTSWWWWHSTTTPSTTTPWWWRHSTTTPSTAPSTTPSTTTPWWWWTTTTAPSTTPSTTTPWWWRHSTTTTAPTTTPRTTTPYTTTGQLHATSAPLSKLPLQFSLLVDPPAPSCQDGLYLPKFVQPTPENGARIHAEVNKEVEIRVKAQAAYATLHDIIISGPMNISKHRNTHDEFFIRWTPIPDDLGDHFPICFAVESVTGSAASTGQATQNHHHHHFSTPTSQSGIYQSEMRCVLVEVRNQQVKAHVVCSESTMTVHVDKSSFNGLHEDHLRLSDPTNTVCSLQTHSNSTHVIAVVPLNACGTQIEEDDDNLIFKNEITTVDNSRDLITRKHLLEVQFYCEYPKRGNVTLGFTAHRENVTVWERGFGTFTYDFEFYPDNQYQTRIDPNSYPLEYDIGSKIYMQLEATSSVNNTELFVDSCRAAPYDNPTYHPTYSIIENGCKVDPTVEIYSPAHNKQFRFSMEAFKFIGLHDQVYISCSVLMCEAGVPNTRCSQGCINSTWPSGHHHHNRKREAVVQTANHYVSQGPLRLRRSAETPAATVTNLNLNLVFIAGCLLAALGMVCGLAMYKVKMSKVKYQPLPTFES